MPLPALLSLLTRLGGAAAEGAAGAAGRAATAGRYGAQARQGAHAAYHAGGQANSFKMGQGLGQGGWQQQTGYVPPMGGGGKGPPPGPTPAQEAMKQLGQYAMDRVTQMAAGKVEGLVSKAIDQAQELLSPTAWRDKILQGGADMAKRGRNVIQDQYVELFSEALPQAGKNFVRELNALTQAIVERGRELGKYSGPLSEAAARADVRRIKSEMNEAQVAGGGYSRVIDAQSRLENTLRDIFAPLKGAIANRLADLLERLADVIEASGIKQAVAILSELSNFGSALMSLDPARIGKAIEDMPENIRKALFEHDNEDEMGDLVKEELERIERRRAAGGDQRPAPRRFDDRFKFPIVRGL